MATVTPKPRERARDAESFGGVIPCGAIGRSGETTVIASAVEHYVDGAAVSMVILTDAPGMVEWDPGSGSVVHDDRGRRYDAHALSATSGPSQLTTTVWVTPAIPSDAGRLELVIDGVARVNPARGGGAGIARPLGGGPWNLVIELTPPRTAADIPPPGADRGPVTQSGSVPIRSRATFVDLVPVGQARFVEDAVVTVGAVERYWDRAVLTVSALGQPGDAALAPAIGRAAIEVWDDLGHRYEATAFHGSAHGAWSEVAVEVVPAIAPDAGVLGIRLADIPAGSESDRREVGPVTFGVRLPVG